jgi:hypothetical protein
MRDLAYYKEMYVLLRDILPKQKSMPCFYEIHAALLFTARKIKIIERRVLNRVQ